MTNPKNIPKLHAKDRELQKLQDKLTQATADYNHSQAAKGAKERVIKLRDQVAKLEAEITELKKD